MEQHRSSRVSFGTRASTIDQHEFISPIDDQQETSISIRDFLRTCPYRIDQIDRQSLIKHQDIDACLNRLSRRDDVFAVIVATIHGEILYDCPIFNQWIPILSDLCRVCQQTVRNLDPRDTIQAFRLRTKTHEILMTIEHEQILIVMQILSSRHNEINQIKSPSTNQH